jgi:ribonuclease HII
MNKADYECAQIIDDSDEEYVMQKVKPEKKEKPVKEKKEKPVKEKKEKPVKEEKVAKPKAELLKKCYNEGDNVFEIGVDEVGRGPLFGRVYTAAVILPKDDSFDCSMVKDSKKFHSKNKIEEASKYIKENALAWYISFEDEKKIDEINILQATQLSMHNSILEVRKQYKSILKEFGKEEKKDYSFSLLIDGNYFKPVTYLDKKTNKLECIPHVTIEGGDNKYASIAAASILAKVERDKYINELCEQNPTLAEYYSIDSNKGYGAKKHLDGIKEHGITIWHRRSFGICKSFV